MFPVWHIGSNYLHEIAKNWYDYLVDKGVNLVGTKEVVSIDFKKIILNILKQMEMTQILL
jgi:uncharacterized FAD-dependent dehydrogenase